MRYCPGSPFDCPPKHLGSKITFSWSASDLVSESGIRLGSIAGLELHEDLHGVVRIAFDAVTKRDGEDLPSARDDAESGGGVGGGDDE